MFCGVLGESTLCHFSQPGSRLEEEIAPHSISSTINSSTAGVSESFFTYCLNAKVFSCLKNKIFSDIHINNHYHRGRINKKT